MTKNVAASELTVISWILPQRKSVRLANRKAREYPAEEWVRIRVYGEECNAALRKHVAESLTQADLKKRNADNCSRYL